jgi:hypothetical protein
MCLSAACFSNHTIYSVCILQFEMLCRRKTHFVLISYSTCSFIQVNPRCLETVAYVVLRCWERANRFAYSLPVLVEGREGCVTDGVGAVLRVAGIRVDSHCTARHDTTETSMHLHVPATNQHDS